MSESERKEKQSAKQRKKANRRRANTQNKAAQRKDAQTKHSMVVSKNVAGANGDQQVSLSGQVVVPIRAEVITKEIPVPTEDVISAESLAQAPTIPSESGNRPLDFESMLKSLASNKRDHESAIIVEKKAVSQNIKLISAVEANQMRVMSVFFVNPFDVHFDPTQPRTEFSQEDLEALSKSVELFSQEEAAHVYVVEVEGKLIMVQLNGERRNRACRLGYFPLMVQLRKKPENELQKLTSQVNSNEAREEIGPLAKAKQVKRFLELGVQKRNIPLRFGKKVQNPEAWVDNLLQYLDLAPELQAQMVASIPKKERLGPGHAAVIAKIRGFDQQRVFRERTKGYTISQVHTALRNMQPASAQEEESEKVVIDLKNRKPSDDRRVMDDRNKAYAQWAAVQLDLPLDKFKAMFKDVVTTGAWELSVGHATRAMNNARALLSKLEAAKPLDKK